MSEASLYWRSSVDHLSPGRSRVSVQSVVGPTLCWQVPLPAAAPGPVCLSLPLPGPGPPRPDLHRLEDGHGQLGVDGGWWGPDCVCVRSVLGHGHFWPQSLANALTLMIVAPLETVGVAVGETSARTVILKVIVSHKTEWTR